jgi:hypothetical protein
MLDLSMVHADVDDEVAMRRKQYKCHHFRILIIGRANAGKTTILEKVCGVAKGTRPIICDGDSKFDKKTQATFASSVFFRHKTGS